MAPSMYCPVVDDDCSTCFTGLASQPGLAFAAYPFNDHYKSFMQELHNDWAGQGIDLYLPHNDFQPTIIFCKLVPHIYESQFVVSEVTDVNQNVLFEHGYALGLGRQSIFLRHRDAKSELPRYLQDIERFEYHHRSDLTSKIATFLDQTSIKREGTFARKGSALPGWLTEQVPMEPGLIYFIEAGVQQDVIRELRKTLNQRPFRLESDSALAKGHYLANYVRMLRKSQFVVGHLIGTRFQRHDETNAAVAFLLGMATGLKKPMLVLQQEPAPKAMIDLQGLIRSYGSEAEAKAIAAEWLEQIKSRVADAKKTIVVPVEPPRDTDLQNLTFGDRAAERDPHLSETFLETAHYQRALKGQCHLFLGPRGAGKTADFLRLTEKYSESPSTLSVIIRPYDSEFLKLKGFLTNSFATLNYQFVHGTIWRALIYTEILNCLAEGFGRGSTGSSPAEQRAFGFWTANPELFEGSFTDRLERMVSGIDQIDPADKAAPVEQVKRLVKTARLDEIATLLRTLGTERPIRVLIDGLDANWDANDTSSIYLLAGLIHIADEINSEFGDNVRITTYMRSDIFDVISKVDPDLDKRGRDFLHWNPELLVRLLGLRIQYSLGSSLPPDACWREVFPERADGQPVEEYLIARTLMRPRDLINFATACVIEAQDRFHEMITQDDILRAESKYSEARLSDLEQEHMATYPDLAELTAAFLGDRHRLTEGKLVDLLSRRKEELRRSSRCPEWLSEASPMQLVRILYEIGFIGVASRGQVTYSYDKIFDRAWAAASQLRPRKKGPRPKKKRKRQPPKMEVSFEIHPAFRAYLELT